MNHVFRVDGMTCQHCVRAVEDAVHNLDEQATVTVDLPTKLVSISTKLSAETLVSAITEAGYSTSAQALS